MQILADNFSFSFCSHSATMGDDAEWIPIPKANEIWSHFDRRKTNNDRRCKQCKKIFKGQFIGSARYHLEKIHGKTFAKTDTITPSTSTQPQLSAQPSISSVFASKKETCEIVLARLCAVDRFAFSSIAGSEDIMKGLKARGFQVPGTANGIKGAVFRFADSIKAELKRDIERKIKDGNRFSVSLDEYTSIRN